MWQGGVRQSECQYICCNRPWSLVVDMDSKLLLHVLGDAVLGALKVGGHTYAI
jgi:hypothetical protein